MNFKRLLMYAALFSLLTIILIISFVSLDNFKDHFSNELKEQYGISVVFAEPIDHSLWAPTTLRLKNVKASTGEREILSIGEAAVDFDLSRFVFGGDIVFKTILLKNTRVDLQDEDLQKFSSSDSNEETAQTSSSSGIFAIDSLTVHNTSVNYGKINLQEIEIDGRIHDQRIIANQLVLKGYDGDVNIKGEINLSTLYFNIAGTLRNIELGKFLPLFGDEAAVVSGIVSAELDVKKDADEWSSLSGKIKIHGSSLLVQGIDLDQLLDGFIDSREVGLLDVTSFFTLGPVGLLLTNTLEGGKSFSIWGKGETAIQEIMVSLEASDARTQIQDVALSTKDKRVALSGGINLENYAFESFAFHILDRDGCSRIFQKIEGTITEPDIGITKTFVDGVISPVTDVLKRTKNLFSCTPVYSGVVKHPERSFFGW